MLSDSVLSLSLFAGMYDSKGLWVSLGSFQAMERFRDTLYHCCSMDQTHSHVLPKGTGIGASNKVRLPKPQRILDEGKNAVGKEATFSYFSPFVYLLINTKRFLFSPLLSPLYLLFTCLTLAPRWILDFEQNYKIALANKLNFWQQLRLNSPAYPHPISM